MYSHRLQHDRLLARATKRPDSLTQTQILSTHLSAADAAIAQLQVYDLGKHRFLQRTACTPLDKLPRSRVLG